jgi:hypothetical protein
MYNQEHNSALGTWLHAVRLFINTSAVVVPLAFFFALFFLIFETWINPWLGGIVGGLDITAPIESKKFLISLLYYFCLVLFEAWTLIVIMMYYFSWLMERKKHLRTVVLAGFPFLPNLLWGLLIYDLLIEMPSLIVLMVGSSLGFAEYLGYLGYAISFVIALSLIYFPFAILFHTPKIGEAFKFSIKLIKGRWIYVIFALGVPLFVFTLPFMFAYTLSNWIGITNVTWLHLVFYTLVMPFMTSVYLLIGYNLALEKGIQLNPSFLAK